MNSAALQARRGFVGSLPNAAASLPALIFTATLFAFCHPYRGLIGDSTVYIARILADLDPDGLGRDLMFANDGQSKFSLFPILARPLVAGLGASNAALLIAALGSASWFLGLSVLARALAPGRTAWALVATVAVLPVDYGQIGIFSVAETAAIPRPFAEAAVMASLAALLSGRMMMAGLGLGFALVIHPIMALGGLGVAAFMLRPARLAPTFWLVAASAGVLAGALVLGWLGVPLFDRLFIRPDGVWLDMLTQRSPHLFPTLWTESSFAPLMVQSATIAIAAHLVDPSRRRFFVAVPIVVVVGLVAAIVLADRAHLLFAIQAQFWRATWLATVMGGCALALCVARLWGAGNIARIVLALLALGWFTQPDPVTAAFIAGAALFLYFGGALNARAVTSLHVKWIYVFACLMMLVCWATHMLGWFAYLRDLPRGDAPGLVDPLRNNLHSLPCCLIVAIWLLGSSWSTRTPIAWVIVPALGTLLLVGGTFILWDQRSEGGHFLEQHREPPGFSSLTAGRSREVLWLDTRAEAWFALGRPQYMSKQQAVSIVFSRPLAMEWRRRATLLVSLGLVGPEVFTPNALEKDHEHAPVTQSGLDAFCNQPGAPGAVIMNLERERPHPVLRDMITWRLPQPMVVTEHSLSALNHHIEGYVALPCGPRS